jgi:hypothetical protein
MPAPLLPQRLLKELQRLPRLLRLLHLCSLQRNR